MSSKLGQSKANQTQEQKIFENVFWASLKFSDVTQWSYNVHAEFVIDDFTINKSAVVKFKSLTHVIEKVISNETLQIP